MSQDMLSSLFGPAPWQIQQQRQAQDAERAQQYAQMNATQRGVAGMYEAGASLGRIGAGMMGLVDPAEQQAKMQQAIMSSGVDTETPKGMRELAQKFSAAGMPQQALMLATKAREVEAAQAKAEMDRLKGAAAINKDVAETEHKKAQTADIGNTAETKFIDQMLKEPEGSPKRVVMENTLKQKGLELSKQGVEGKPGWYQPVIVEKTSGKTTPFGPPVQDKSGVSVTNINSTAKGDDEYAKQRLGGQAKRAEELEKAAESAYNANLALDRFVADSKTGPEGGAAKLVSQVGNVLSTFGYSSESLRSVAGMNQAIGDVLSNKMAELGARGLTDKDMEILKMSLPMVETSKAARESVAAILKKLNNSTIQSWETMRSEEGRIYPGVSSRMMAPSWYNKYKSSGANPPPGFVVNK